MLTARSYSSRPSPTFVWLSLDPLIGCYGVPEVPKHAWYCRRCEPHSLCRASKKVRIRVSCVTLLFSWFLLSSLNRVAVFFFFFFVFFFVFPSFLLSSPVDRNALRARKRKARSHKRPEMVSFVKKHALEIVRRPALTPCSQSTHKQTAHTHTHTHTHVNRLGACDMRHVLGLSFLCE